MVLSDTGLLTHLERCVFNDIYGENRKRAQEGNVPKQNFSLESLYVSASPMMQNGKEWRASPLTSFLRVPLGRQKNQHEQSFEC